MSMRIATMRSKIVASCLLLFMVLTSVTSEADDSLIAHKVLQRSELGRVKLSLDVEVSLIDGRLPTEAELATISNVLVSQERTHERSFVTFYLPGMKIGHGAFATAHHNPDMEVNILMFMLNNYPEYEKFIPDDQKY